jgi:hypothetical protein
MRVGIVGGEHKVGRGFCERADGSNAFSMKRTCRSHIAALKAYQSSCSKKEPRGMCCDPLEELQSRGRPTTLLVTESSHGGAAWISTKHSLTRTRSGSPIQCKLTGRRLHKDVFLNPEAEHTGRESAYSYSHSGLPRIKLD